MDGCCCSGVGVAGGAGTRLSCKCDILRPCEAAVDEFEPLLFSQLLVDVLGGRRALALLLVPRLLLALFPARLNPVIVPMELVPPRQFLDRPRPLLIVAEEPGPVPTLVAILLEEGLPVLFSFVRSITDASLSFNSRYLVSIGEHRRPRIGLYRPTLSRRGMIGGGGGGGGGGGIGMALPPYKTGPPRPLAWDLRRS